jgi:hypothetical protein
MADWYLSFLAQCFRDSDPIWRSVLGPEATSAHSFSTRQYRFMTCLAKALSDVEKPTLSTIVENLVAEEVVAADIKSRDSIFQLVFLALGWLSMLFEPAECNSSPGKINVLAPVDRNGDEMSTETFKVLSKNLHDICHLPVHQLLKHFGQLLPVPQALQENTMDSQEQSALAKQLVAHRLSYPILLKVAGIRIEFTSALSMHLELDDKSKTLKIFRYPTFCALVCSGRRGGKTKKVDIDELTAAPAAPETTKARRQPFLKMYAESMSF